MVFSCEVADFKSMTDENQLISSIIHDDFSYLLPEPILDVGSGLGDIPKKALYQKKTILTDVNDIDLQTLSPNHSFLCVNFFDLDETTFLTYGFPETVMIIHTLQYLDDDMARLQEKLTSLNPQKILLVTNDNTLEMAEIIKFFTEKIPLVELNPEYPDIDFLPNIYVLEKIVKFKSKLVCHTFNELATQVAYLMDCTLDSSQHNALSKFLKNLLIAPSFSISQSVRLFRKSITLI